MVQQKLPNNPEAMNTSENQSVEIQLFGSPTITSFGRDSLLKVSCWGGVDHIDLTPKPNVKTHSVDGILFDHNHSQEMPEIIGEWFDLDALNIEGYRLGDHTCKSPKLKWTHFLRVQKFNETRHPKTRVPCVNVLAWAKKGHDSPVLLICKYKSK